MHRISVHSDRREQLVDITDAVAAAVTALGVADGGVLLHVPHTTAAVTINEGYDPDVGRDVEAALRRIAPEQGGYAHAEGNSDAHVKAILVGSTQVLPVEAGEPVLGRWQRIFFCEFDGPRSRQLLVGRL